MACWLCVYGNWLCSLAFLQLFPLASWTSRLLPHLSTSITHGFPLHLQNHHHHPQLWSKHMRPHFYNWLWFSTVVSTWPGPSQERLPHKSQLEVQQIWVRWITLPLHLASVLFPTHFSNSFSQTVWILAPIKAFLSFPLPLFSVLLARDITMLVRSSQCSRAKADTTNWWKQPWSDK